MFGPHIENDKYFVAPFHITLTIHDHLLHNCMLDSGASHNLMPKEIMDKLGLQITIPYLFYESYMFGYDKELSF